MANHSPPTPMTTTLSTPPRPSPHGEPTRSSFFQTETEIARHHVTSSRAITRSLLNKLNAIQRRLSEDLELVPEEVKLEMMRKWAGDVLDTAWEVVAKAGRLVDDVEFLMSRVEGDIIAREQKKRKRLSGQEEGRVGNEQGEEMEADGQTGGGDEKVEGAGQDDPDEMLLDL